MNLPGASEQQALPFVSVILPAFNEERHIPTCFEALASQDFATDRYEVILVDNASTDRTAELAGSFQDRLNVKVVSKIGGSIAEVRNYGAALAKGELLAFLDCDCVAPPDWIKLAVMHGARDLVWGAHYSTPHNAGWVATTWEQFQAQQLAGPVPFLPSGNLWLYKTSFEEIGRFNTAQQTSEDVELCQRARRHGLRIEAFPDISVLHYGVPEGLKRFYLQNRWHGKHVLRMFLSNLPKLTYLPLLTLTFYVLLMSMAACAGAVAALLYHRPALFVLPASLLVLPILLIALRKTLQQRQLAALPRLFVLYLTYFAARAAALVQSSTPRHR